MGSLLEFPGLDPRDAEVGARLKHWREHRGVELEDLARQLGVTPENARRVEAGRGHLTSLQIGLATSALHLPLWALVSDRPAY